MEAALHIKETKRIKKRPRVYPEQNPKQTVLGAVIIITSNDYGETLLFRRMFFQNLIAEYWLLRNYLQEISKEQGTAK